MKKKNNKTIGFIKENWYFVLLIIPFVFFCIENRSADNDIWFIMTNGRYVLNHGIPHIDPFTIHEGLHYVMQQWLSSVIFYGVYAKLGGYGLLTFTLIYSCLVAFIYYRLCYSVSKNKILSVIITVVVFIISRKYFVFRPQIFTYTVFLLELICMEKYIKTGNWKRLIWMPILSLLLINMHASMWLLQFVFMLPVLCNCIKIKGITIDKIKIKPLLLTMVVMLLVGFINPYGYKAITFVFSTYGIPEINHVVTEMEASNLEMFHWKLCVLLLLVIIGLIALNKKVKLDVRDILFLCGSFLFASMHGKCIIYFVWYSGFILAKILLVYKDFVLVKDIKKIYSNKFMNNLVRGLKIGLSFCLVLTFFFTSIELVKIYNMQTDNTMEAVDYIVDNYNKEDVILYTDFTNGGYAEFNDLKSYIDPRAELFHIKLNKKENIIAEYIAVTEGTINFDNFVNKYKFTHIIVMDQSSFNKYLLENDDYTVGYTYYFDSEGKVPFYRLYVRSSEAANEKDS